MITGLFGAGVVCSMIDHHRLAFLCWAGALMLLFS
jgi:hypothetical protein